MLKVYGHPMSTCTRRVLLTLAEKGQQAEMVIVDLSKGEQKQPAHLSRQPFGVIPVLEDDGYSLFESRAIIHYLDARFPDPPLSPADVRARGKMEQWISVDYSYFQPAATKIIAQMIWIPMRGGKTDPAIVEQGRAETGKVLDIVDKALGEHPYLAGDQFSLAEISWMPYVDYLIHAKAGDLITSRKNFAAWWERVSTRPTWQKVTAKSA